jgi:small GTP-binding protein
MSESAKTIIKYFCDRFLNLDVYPSSIKAILDLPLTELKEVSKEEAKILKKKKFKKIRDVANLKKSDFKKLLKKEAIEKKTLLNIYIAANLISNSWNKRNVYLKKVKMKVVIAGLDYAGKTSLVNKLVHNYNYMDLVNQEPTIGVNVEEFQTDQLNLILWDLGGQKRNIDEYLEEPEKFFIQVDVLIFVVDAQDDVRYEEALEYFKDLLNILDYLDEFPYILVLLNKADSDIIDDPDFQIKLEYLTDKITTLVENQEKKWNVEIIPTSIYNVYSNQPEIARSIKSIFSGKTSTEESKETVEIDFKLQKILDLNLKLTDKVVSELQEIKRILGRVLTPQMSKSLFEIPFQKVPSNFISETQKQEVKESGSIPKPLDFLERSILEGPQNIHDELKEFSFQKRSEKEEESKPPMAPKKDISIKKLNPPSKTQPSTSPKGSTLGETPSEPPLGPSSSPSSDTQDQDKFANRGNLRRQIISELKDVLVKRGIAK